MNLTIPFSGKEKNIDEIWIFRGKQTNESNQRVDLTVAPSLQSKRSFAAGKVLGLIDGLHCRATAGHT